MALSKNFKFIAVWNISKIIKIGLFGFFEQMLFYSLNEMQRVCCSHDHLIHSNS